MTITKRGRNRRGEGWKLRRDIVRAAEAILDETATPDAVTIRGVAQRAGVSPSAIYRHFAHCDEILVAVRAELDAELSTELDRALEPVSTPRERLPAVCRAHVAFAERHANRYLALCGHPPPSGTASVEADLDGGPVPVLASAYARMAAALPGSGCCPRDEHLTATALWAAVHGVSTLRLIVPTFPWPPVDAVLARLIESLVTGPSGPAGVTSASTHRLDPGSAAATMVCR